MAVTNVSGSGKPREPNFLVCLRTIAENPTLPVPETEGTMRMAQNMYQENQRLFFQTLSQQERDFQRRLHQWEGGRRGRRQGMRKKRPEAKDEGTDKCLDLVEQLLKELGCKPGEGL